MCLAATGAAAQSITLGQWWYGDTEFRRNAAWVLGRAPDRVIETLTADCETSGGAAMLYYTPWSMPAESVADGALSLAIDGQLFDLPAFFDTNVAEPSWTAPLTAEVAQALMAGNRVNVIQGNRGVAFGLKGSSRTLKQVLADCVPATFTLPEKTPEEARAAVLARIEEQCKGPANLGDTAIVQVDVTGDGKVDHLLDWTEVSCVAPGPRGGGYCGIRQCSVDVWVAPAAPPMRPTKSILHLGLTYPSAPGESLLSFTDRGDTFAWRWTGTDFDPVKVSP